MEAQSSALTSGTTIDVADEPSASTLRKVILRLLMNSGSLPAREISWRLGFSSKIVRDELLTLQRDGLVFVSSWGLLEDYWAITEKENKNMCNQNVTVS